MHFQFYNPQEAFVAMLTQVLKYGEDITVRGSETKELRNVTLTIANPTMRCLMLPHRNDNVFAKIAETLWVLGGHNNIDYLKFFLPRAPEWSDDGKHWRAGYGPRLRRWQSVIEFTHGFKATDQVNECRKLLCEDPNTRRAVMSLWNPTEDYQYSLDIPCNNWLHWMIRKDVCSKKLKLHLNIAQRSSDVLWGFSGINLFEWSVLHELMAHWTGVEVGELTYFISSLHLYEKHFNRADMIVEEYTGRDVYEKCFEACHPKMEVAFDGFDNMLRTIENNVWAIIHNVNDGSLGSNTVVADPFFDLCAKMLCLFAYDKVRQDHPKRVDALLVMLNSLPDSDFRLAALEYYLRTVPEVVSVATDREIGILKTLHVLQA